MSSRCALLGASALLLGLALAFAGCSDDDGGGDNASCFVGWRCPCTSLLDCPDARFERCSPWQQRCISIAEWEYERENPPSPTPEPEPDPTPTPTPADTTDGGLSDGGGDMPGVCQGEGEPTHFSGCGWIELQPGAERVFNARDANGSSLALTLTAQRPGEAMTAERCAAGHGYALRVDGALVEQAELCGTVYRSLDGALTPLLEGCKLPLLVGALAEDIAGDPPACDTVFEAPGQWLIVQITRVSASTPDASYVAQGEDFGPMAEALYYRVPLSGP